MYLSAMDDRFLHDVSEGSNDESASMKSPFDGNHVETGLKIRNGTQGHLESATDESDTPN
jgi:hypothetical protein